MTIARSTIAVLIVGSIWVPAFEVGATEPDRGEPVRVYTNSDLSRFGPSAPVPDHPIVESSVVWLDIERFLDREYARIDADRRYSLDLLDADRRDRIVDIAESERFWGWGWGASLDYCPGCVTGYRRAIGVPCARPESAGEGRGTHAGRVVTMPDRPKRWNDLAGGKSAGGGSRMTARKHGRTASRR